MIRAAAGKSSLTKRVIGSEFPKEYQPTIISTYTRDMLVEQVMFHMDIVDTAGQVRRAVHRQQSAYHPPSSPGLCVQDEYTQIPKEAAIGVHGYVLVYDSSSRESFMQVRASALQQWLARHTPHC